MSLICSIPLISLIFNVCLPPEPLATGYVEGDYVLIAPIETAQITAIPIKRGDRVEFDQPLALLERRDAEIAVAEAAAALTKAKSELANISQGARPEKIAVLKASLVAAQSSAAEAERERDRQKKLADRGSSPKAKYDQARTAYDVSLAKVREVEANLAVARLPARHDEIEAAKAVIKRAEASLEAAQWRLKKRTLRASQAGIISDVIRESGEVAGPQAPVLSLLPDNGVKLRLYLPQNDLSNLSIGSNLQVECDGCSDEITARVSYISEGPEFTPPVIYSLENRQKLVYLIEAKIKTGEALKPGQIVSVHLNQTKPEAQ